MVDELTLEFLFSIYVLDESVAIPKFNFAEYFEKSIRTQLVNLNSLRSFRYQAYLLHLFLYQNDSKFHDIETVLDDATTIVAWSLDIRSHENNIGVFNFINKIMSRIHLMIFQTTLFRISQELKDLL